MCGGGPETPVSQARYVPGGHLRGIDLQWSMTVSASEAPKVQPSQAREQLVKFYLLALAIASAMIALTYAMHATNVVSDLVK